MRLIITTIVAVWVARMATGFGPRSLMTQRMNNKAAFISSSTSLRSTDALDEPLVKEKDLDLSSSSINRGIGFDGDKKLKPRIVKRTWKGGRQSMKVDFILPESGTKNIRGVIFFLHGFSQEPKAYQESLEHLSDKLQVAIVAPEVDLDSRQVLEDIIQKVGDKFWCLQRALAYDTIQCIDMTLRREAPFTEFLPKSSSTSIPFGVMGHSMGGGLSWFVASQFPQKISYVGAMAPFKGVPDFEPTSRNAPRHSLHISGSWDFLAKPSEVKKLTTTANSVTPDSSVYVEIDRGLHTGFEDDLVLFNVPIESLTWTFWYFQIFGIVDLFLVNFIIEPLLTSKAQLNLSRALMEYTFDCMIKNKELNEDDLWSSLKNNAEVQSDWLNRVKVSK